MKIENVMKQLKRQCQLTNAGYSVDLLYILVEDLIEEFEDKEGEIDTGYDQ